MNKPYIAKATQWVASALLLSLISIGSAQAAVQGVYLGTFGGNDSEQQIFDDLNLFVTELATINTPDEVTTSTLSDGGLTISNMILNDDMEAISGDWSYSGAGTVDLIVIKAGNVYAAYLYADGNDGGMPNMGIWNTLHVDNKGLSHITAYEITAVPVPAAVWLFGSALIGVAGLRRR